MCHFLDIPLPGGAVYNHWRRYCALDKCVLQSVLYSTKFKQFPANMLCSAISPDNCLQYAAYTTTPTGVRSNSFTQVSRYTPSCCRGALAQNPYIALDLLGAGAFSANSFAASAEAHVMSVNKTFCLLNVSLPSASTCLSFTASMHIS